MKKITRTIFFSWLSIYATSIVIKGFQINLSLFNIVLLSVTLGFFHNMIAPVMKLLLLPLNLLSLGFVSTVVYIIFFNILLIQPGFVSFEPWVFDGIKFGNFTIPELSFGTIQSSIMAALSYSFSMHMLHKLL